MTSLPILNCTLAKDSNSYTPKLHPLCIDEVLGVLFKYFTFSELKKLRTVCRAWEKEARHLLISESRKWELAPIILTREKDASKFLNVVRRPISFLNFGVFYLVNFVYDRRKSSKASKYLRLLQVYGHHIKILHLKNFVIKGALIHFSDFFYELEQLCPNLERLVLASFTLKSSSPTASTSEDPYSEHISTKFARLISLAVIIPTNSKEDGFGQTRFDFCIRHLFEIAPNLEEFTYFDRSGESKFPLDSLVGSIQNGSLQKLTKIHLDSGRGDLHVLQQFKVLQNLKLRYLKIGLDAHGLNPQLAEEAFLKLLEAQNNTLTSLQLHFNICDISNWQTFLKPTLPLHHIQELNIPFKIFSFSLLKFVHLKKLVLRRNPKSNCWIEETTDNYNIPDSDPVTGGSSTLSHSLSNWIIESGSSPVYNEPLHLRCEFIVDEATMIFFAKKFTNIHTLEFGYLSEDVLLFVYENFQNLAQLSIVCPPALYVSSRAYLGESKTIALTESKMSGFKLDIETRNKVAEKIRQSPKSSILCLSKLRRLELTRFGSMVSINRIHHSIECSSGFMFGISALQNVKELKLHPFIHKRAVMSLRLMPSLKVVWAVPLIIGSRETGGRSDYPTTAYWYQVLLRKRSELKIYVTTAPTSRERDVGIVGTATRLLQISDVYRGNATSVGLFVYLDEYFIYQDGCEVPKPERIDSSTSSCSLC